MLPHILLTLRLPTRPPAGLLPQGTKAQQVLVSKAQQYMIRRTSETLKQYLPAKVQEASGCMTG